MNEISLKNSIDEYYDMIFNYIIKISLNYDIAFDITQETFLRLKKYINNFSDSYKVKKWLFKTSRNLFNNIVTRDLKKKIPYDKINILKYSNTDFEDKFESQRRIDIINQKMKILSAAERELFILYFEYNYKLSEIAELTGKNINTVKTHIYRAIKKLKD